jgi:hypothetical protein
MKTINKKKEFTLETARIKLANISRSKAQLVAEEKELQAMIDEHCGELFKNELAKRNKEYGDVTLEIENEKVTMKITKSVDWDSEALYTIARAMGPQKAVNLMVIECKIPESNYSKLSIDDPFIKDINKARTVKYSAPKFIFSTIKE